MEDKLKINPSKGSGKNTSSSSGRAASMADLMAKHATKLVTFQKGDILQGKITKISQSEILVDIGSKAQALVLEKDKKLLRTLLATLKAGDSVSVSVLNPESDYGNPVVSLRRFMGDIVWDKLSTAQKDQAPIKISVQDSTRGGFLVSTLDGASGFLPQSQTAYLSDQTQLVGQTIEAYVLELQKATRKIIFSQRPVITQEEFKERIKGLRAEQKINSIVSNSTSFGLFVTIPVSNKKTLDGFIHISEISWEKTEDALNLFTAGQALEAVIVGFDREAKRVELSIKRLSLDPFENIAKEFPIDKKVTGKVIKVNSQGISLELESSHTEQKVEGTIRKEKLPPNSSYEIGQTIGATVSEVDLRRRRILLSPVLKEKPIGYK